VSSPVRPGSVSGGAPCAPLVGLRSQGRVAWLVYLAFALTVSAVYFALPQYHLALWTPLGLSSVVATVVAINRYRPQQRVAWYLLAGAEFCFISGDTVYNILTLALHQENPFPSIADVFYLLTYPLFAAGIFLFIRGRSAARDRASLIDALMITVSLGLLSWVFLILPNFQAPGLTGVQRSISVAYPLGDVLVLAMLARLVGAGGLRGRSMQFLVLGAAGLLVSDVLYGLIQLNGVWHVGGPTDAGWVTFYVAWGCAALHPSMVRLGEIQLDRRPPMGRLRVTLLAGVTLIVPVVLFAESVTGKDVHASTVALFSAALSLLVIARLWGILDVHQQSVKRERILRSFGGALVAAHDPPEIFQVALDGASALTGAAEVTRVGIYLAGPDGVRCVAQSGAPQDDERRELFWGIAVEGGHFDAAGTLSVTSLRYDLETRGMLVVERLTPLTLDLHGALSTLAAQVALALESASLAENLRQRQSEEQFRGILQNSSDIIVVVNARGDITYGTPSLGRNLGLPPGEVLGRSLAEFLDAKDGAGAIAMFAGFAAGTSATQAITDWHLRHRDGALMAFEVLSNNMLDDALVGGIVLTMRDVSERRALEVQLKHQAFHDALTGLPNRALFHDRAEHALARTAQRGSVVALLLLDLDDFKIVNDTRGHAAGDELLIQVAARLRSTVRGGATVSRLGGDEFAVLVEDLADVSEAESFARRALFAFAKPFTVLGEILRVGASAGLVVTGGPHDSLDMTDLMRSADLAVYAAKDRGKGQVMLYHKDLRTRMLDRLSRRSDLERAIDGDEFVLHFQPIVTIETGEVVGCEALVRWDHPSRGLLPPVDFVELTEETGMIVELGRWVLDQACAQTRLWADAGHPGLRMSVNVSARQMQETGFVDEVRAALVRHRVLPGQLVLELTESIFALDAPVISEQLRALRDLGIKIAMDDFGTGYSSLSYLQKFQMDILKVDKSFVDGLGVGDLDGSALVNAIISLAHSLRLEVVAEGIERAGQRDELWSMGCRLAQGYLYSKPVEPDQLFALLSSSAQLGPHPVTGKRDINRLRVPALRSVPTPAQRISEELNP